MTFAASNYTRLQILRLCSKVKEVLNNNDWPTEEGQDKENYESPIRKLVLDIEKELNR